MMDGMIGWGMIVWTVVSILLIVLLLMKSELKEEQRGEALSAGDSCPVIVSVARAAQRKDEES